MSATLWGSEGEVHNLGSPRSSVEAPRSSGRPTRRKNRLGVQKLVHMIPSNKPKPIPAPEVTSHVHYQC